MSEHPTFHRVNLYVFNTGTEQWEPMEQPSGSTGNEFAYVPQEYSWTVASITFAPKTLTMAATEYQVQEDFQEIELGFTVHIFGKDYTTGCVWSDGGFQFGECERGVDQGYEFPYFSLESYPPGGYRNLRNDPNPEGYQYRPPRFIGAPWTLLGTCDEYTATFNVEAQGVAPNRYLIIDWTDQEMYASSCNETDPVETFTSQIVVYESGLVETHTTHARGVSDEEGDYGGPDCPYCGWARGATSNLNTTYFLNDDPTEGANITDTLTESSLRYTPGTTTVENDPITFIEIDGTEQGPFVDFELPPAVERIKIYNEDVADGDWYESVRADGYLIIEGEADHPIEWQSASGVVARMNGGFFGMRSVTDHWLFPAIGFIRADNTNVTVLQWDGVDKVGLGGSAAITAMSFVKPIELQDGVSLRGNNTGNQTYKFSVYDTNTGPGFVDWLTVTSGDTPTVNIASPAGGTVLTIAGMNLSTAVTHAGAGVKRFLCIDENGVVTSQATACA